MLCRRSSRREPGESSRSAPSPEPRTPHGSRQRKLAGASRPTPIRGASSRCRGGNAPTGLRRGLLRGAGHRNWVAGGNSLPAYAGSFSPCREMRNFKGRKRGTHTNPKHQRGTHTSPKRQRGTGPRRNRRGAPSRALRPRLGRPAGLRRIPRPHSIVRRQLRDHTTRRDPRFAALTPHTD